MVDDVGVVVLDVAVVEIVELEVVVAVVVVIVELEAGVVVVVVLPGMHSTPALWAGVHRRT